MATVGQNPLGCVLPRPDIAELSQQVRTELSKRLLGGAPVLPLSSEDILSFVMAGVTNLMHGYVTQSLKEMDPATMCCDTLVVYAARRGINLQGSTRAKGYVAITGTPGASIPATIRFVGESSRTYKLDPGVSFNPVTLNAQGGAVLRIVSTIAGAVFNVDPGRLLTVGSTVNGVDPQGTVVGNGIMGGNDEEDCEALRKRVVAGEANQVTVLNEAWFLQQTMRYPGVTRACTDACQGCCDPNDITIYPFFEGVYGDMREEREPSYGVPPCEVLDEMTLWMFGRENGRGQGLAPVGIRGRYQTAQPAPVTIMADCFVSCQLGAEDRIADALWNYFRYEFCVGSTICKEQVKAAIYRALGSDACMSNIRLVLEPTDVWFEDASNIYLNCGRFPIVGQILLQGVGAYVATTTGALPGTVAMRSVPARSNTGQSIWTR